MINVPVSRDDERTFPYSLIGDYGNEVVITDSESWNE